MTEEEKKQYEKELEEFRKNGYIKTTKENFEEFDFSKTDAPKNAVKKPIKGKKQ
jgi:hypothetical protein